MLQATAATVQSSTGTDTGTQVPPSQEDKEKKITPNTYNYFLSSLERGWKFSYNATFGLCTKPYQI